MSTAKLFASEPSPDSRPSRPRWKAILGWIAGSVLLVLVLAAISVAVALNSARFHGWLLAKIRTEATDSLGVPVGLQNFALHFSHLSVDLYGLTVAGANPYPHPPLLQVQHAEVGVRIVSILHKKWYLSSFRVDHPVVQIFIDKQGVSNIPTFKSSNSQSHITIFDLGVRHAVLKDGVLLYNDRPATLDADLRNLDFHSTFDDTLQKYSGTVAYQDGRVIFGPYRPLEHSFEADFDLTPTTFQLHRAVVTSPAAQVYLAGSASHFNAPVVQGQYQITVDGAQLARVLNNPSIPAGTIRATGTAHYQQVANQTPLDTLSIEGDLTSPRLLVQSQSVRAAIDNIAAHYSLERGNATLRDFRASLLGGEITAQGAMTQIGGNPHSEMTAALRNISLADAAQAFAGRAAPNVAVIGGLNADMKAAWGKTLSDLVASANATVHGQVQSRHAPPGVMNASAASPTSAPLDAELHAAYSGARDEVALHQSYLRTTGATLTLNGMVSKHSSLGIHLQANDLAAIAALADLFRAPAPGQAQAVPLDLAGEATFQGTVQGSTAAPHLAGQLTASHLRFHGTGWKLLRANVDASPSHVSLAQVDLEPLARGRIAGSAQAGLDRWKFTRTSPLQINLTASQLDMAELTRLAGEQIPVSGTLNTQIALHGTELHPEGSGSLSLTKVVAYGQPVNSVHVTFNGTGDQAHADLAIALPAGSVQGEISAQPQEKTYTAQLTTAGIDLGKLQAEQARNLDLTGVLHMTAHAQGSFDNPQLHATVQIPALTLRKQSIQNIRLELAVANHIATANLASNAVNTSIQARALVHLTGDYQTTASLDTQNIPLQPVVAMYSPAQAASLSGETELHATVQGPLKNMKLLQAHVTIPYLKLGYNNAVQLASTGPIHADLSNGVLNVQRGGIRGTDTDLQFQGSVPVQSKEPVSLILQGNVNLQIAQLFDPEIRTSGEMRLNIHSSGSADGSLGGEIDVADASYASPDTPVGLQHGNGVLKLTSNRIDIQSFEGTVGGGQVTAQGGVAYRPSLRFDLGLAAKNVRMLYPQGVRESIDANLTLSGSARSAVLGGTVDLADVSFTPAFELSSLVGQFSSGVAGPPPTGISQNIRLNVAVHSTNDVNLVSRALSLNGSANLQVRGTAAQPVILGRVSLNGGDVILNNNRFVLEGATIQFVNPSETQPVVNASITTTIQQYTIGLHFQGPADQLRTQYTSDPALPQADIINLLAFGQTTEASANAPSTPASQQAESLVASQVTNQITSRISKVAGISQLSISPVLGNSATQGAGANITVQQRVTGNLFVTFSTNTADTQSEVIQGQYQISPRVSLSATRDPNGGFAVDTLIKKTW